MTGSVDEGRAADTDFPWLLRGLCGVSQYSCSQMWGTNWTNRVWGGWKTGWTVRLRELWAVLGSLMGGLLLVMFLSSCNLHCLVSCLTSGNINYSYNMSWKSCLIAIMWKVKNVFRSMFKRRHFDKLNILFKKWLLFLLILQYESNRNLSDVWLRPLFYSKGNCITKLGEGLYCCLRYLIYMPFLCTASTKYLLLKMYFHCLEKRLSSCKAALLTVAKRGIWCNNVVKNGVLLQISRRRQSTVSVVSTWVFNFCLLLISKCTGFLH